MDSQSDLRKASFGNDVGVILMRAVLRRVPWFYVLVTIYPLLFLWSRNVAEIYPSAVVRPLLFTLIGSGILYAILYICFRNLGKASLIGTLILLGFFSYGHIYYEARIVPALQIFSHHSTLIPIYLVFTGLGTWGILFRIKRYESAIRYLNAASLILVMIQVAQLSYSYIRTYYDARHPVTLQSGLTVTTIPRNLPDIYFIVLDGYMRADAMQQDLEFDNTAFIAQLEQLGFYVARCSRPNYDFTRASLASTLNMKYIPNMEEISTIEESSFYTIIKNNEVRYQLESIGYKTVAFETDFPWLNFDDADIFFSRNHSATDFKDLYPFEVLYMNSTALTVLDAAVQKSGIAHYFEAKPSEGEEAATTIPGLNNLQHHIDVQLFTLNKLSEIYSIVGPKFVYVHLIIPHYPYVFDPNGEILTDPGFYSGESGKAINADYTRQGYIYGVQFIDRRIIPILQTIIQESKMPPIIVMEGDHGQSGKNKYTNLNAYYFPNGYDHLYDSISPVNSFRLIFDDYFGANYPLLPDVTHASDTILLNETYQDCKP
jgi:hypothetical protein